MSFLYSIHRYIFGEPSPFSSEDADKILIHLNNYNKMNYKKYDNDNYIILVKYICEDDNYKKHNYNTVE
jgi:hypothetical protein